MRSFAPMPTVWTSIAVDELRCNAVIDFDDGESATHAGIDAGDSHGTTLLELWLARLRDCFGELACVLDVFFDARVPRWRSSAAHTPKVIAWTARTAANRRGSSGGCSAG